MKASEIREWVESSVVIPATWEFADNLLVLTFGSRHTTIRLSGRDIAALKRGAFPSAGGLARVPHCGIEADGYAEYIISVDGWGSWPEEHPLRFKVGDTLVRAGQISEGLALICDSIYRSRDYLQSDFYDSYASLQLEGSKSPREDASVALFYLNSDYLRPLKLYAGIHHLVDPREPDVRTPTSASARVARHRVRVRKRIEALEPVALFNQAATEWGDARFLGFYRVLEFFFMRGALSEFRRLRRDPHVSDAELLASSRLEKELPQLKALSRAVLTPSEARALVDYVRYHELAPARDLDDVVVALYAFRNTLVHAKEAEIHRTRIPNPFQLDHAKGSWVWIVELFAERAIRRLAETTCP